MPDDNMSGSEPVRASDGDVAPTPARRRKRRARRGRGGDAPKNGSRGHGRGGRAYAAIDLGTNNCRLLIAREQGAEFRIIDSYSRVVRLGHKLASTGRLDDASMEATVEALKVCAAKMKSKRVHRWRAIATEACRRADNGEAFIARVKEETGIALEIISPRVEARLAVMGCVNLVDPSKDVALVVDIGGGSTELSWVDIRKLRDGEEHKVHRPPISAWASLPLGVATLSDLVPEREDRTAWYAEMKQAVRDAIADQGCETRFTRAFEEGKGHIIGTSGTITTLAGVHLKLPYYQRSKVDGLWFRSDDCVRVARDMASRDAAGRATEPCIGTDRAGLLVAGCAITDVLCEMWPSKIIRVADRGLREGMLLGLMGAKRTIPGSPS